MGGVWRLCSIPIMQYRRALRSILVKIIPCPGSTAATPSCASSRLPFSTPAQSPLLLPPPPAARAPSPSPLRRSEPTFVQQTCRSYFAGSVGCRRGRKRRKGCGAIGSWNEQGRMLFLNNVMTEGLFGETNLYDRLRIERNCMRAHHIRQFLSSCFDRAPSAAHNAGEIRLGPCTARSLASILSSGCPSPLSQRPRLSLSLSTGAHGVAQEFVLGRSLSPHTPGTAGCTDTCSFQLSTTISHTQPQKKRATRGPTHLYSLSIALVRSCSVWSPTQNAMNIHRSRSGRPI